ncbi:MAG: tRNA 2-thiouridine(34) synthase MnmA [Gammaproteobacteria bacterium]|nr:tRNA 2-thiouridine(34) synthase MnmA [Gammaproteobacteria bacterium]
MPPWPLAAPGAHVVVALSGGVDSAVAAFRLLEQGYRVSALFMKNWEDDDTGGFCSAAADFASARTVCDRLEIPLHAVNFARDYKERVFARFLADCRAGLTPNPDVLCNREIKFDVYWQHARSLGATLMATGHYARCTPLNADQALLKTSRDADRDQTYFLHTIDGAVLRRTLFPIGDLTKEEVRAIARRLGLHNADRKSSTGICFIGERHFKTFLRRYLTDAPGPIRSIDGALKGHHDGLMYYTIGQRHGLGIGGPGEPWYVARKHLADRTLIVAQGRRHPALYRRGCLTAAPSWLTDPPAFPWRGLVKIRYREKAHACTVEPAGEGLRITFTQPAWAVAPGQSAVFYEGDTCLGGAVVTTADDENPSGQTTRQG